MEQKILISVTKKFDPIVTTIESTRDLTTLSVTELMGSLEAYEQRLSRRNEDLTENAFQSKFNKRSQNSRQGDWMKSKENSRRGENSRNGGNIRNQGAKNGKYPPCSICEKTNHLEKDCWFRDKPQCRNCKRFGHEEKNCRLKAKHQANFSKEKEEDGNLFYACQAAREEKEDTWYIDSGCSNHMTANENIFRDIDTSIKSQVRLGNGALVEVKAKAQSSWRQRKVRDLFKMFY